MSTDVGFLYAMAGMSMSVASIAGLVVAFRRTDVWASHDLYRLRQIVEWGFVNALLALGAFPLAGWLGGEAAALHAMGFIALAYLSSNVLLLLRRRRGELRQMVPVTPAVVLIDLAAIVLATVTGVLGTMSAWEITLIAFVGRPMFTFVWVLATLRSEG